MHGDTGGLKQGRIALGVIGVSLSLMALVGMWRSPAAVPRLDRPGPFPVLTWTPANDLGVTILLWVAVIAGTAGVGLGLHALSRGWRPRPGPLLAAGAFAVAVFAAAPPMGSTDPMDYAAYGRIARLGGNPHVTTPAQLRSTGDPVGAYAPREWEDLPSVYGPLATAAQWTAAGLGGTSAARTVLWLKIWNGFAFLGTALLLVRAAGRDRARRARVHLLWTINPLMLWALIGAAHVDGLAAVFSVAALTAVRLSPARRDGPGPVKPAPDRAAARRALLGAFAVGLLLGAAGSVKAPYLLVAAGPLWVLRGSWRRLVALSAGVAAVLLPAYAAVGPEAVSAVLKRGRMPSWNTPWELLAPLFDHGVPPAWLITGGSLLLAVLLTAVFARGLPGTPMLAVGLAVGLAWLLTTPVYYPWYEALVVPLVAVSVPTRLDWLHLARALVATGGCLPGVVFRLGDSWLRSAVTDGPLSDVIPGLLLALTLALAVSVLIRSRSPEIILKTPISGRSLGEPVTARLIHRTQEVVRPAAERTGR